MTFSAPTGQCRATSGGYAVRNSSTTYALYAGNDQLRKRLITAVDARFFSVVSDPKQTPPAVVIEVTVDGDTLTLRRSDTTLTLKRAGTQADLLVQPPSPTATTTS